MKYREKGTTTGQESRALGSRLRGARVDSDAVAVMDLRRERNASAGRGEAAAEVALVAAEAGQGITLLLMRTCCSTGTRPVSRTSVSIFRSLATGKQIANLTLINE